MEDEIEINRLETQLKAKPERMIEHEFSRSIRVLFAHTAIRHAYGEQRNAAFDFYRLLNDFHDSLPLDAKLSDYDEPYEVHDLRMMYENQKIILSSVLETASSRYQLSERAVRAIARFVRYTSL